MWFQRAVEVNSVAAVFYLREAGSWFPRHPNPPVLGRLLSLSLQEYRSAVILICQMRKLRLREGRALT